VSARCRVRLYVFSSVVWSLLCSCLWILVCICRILCTGLPYIAQTMKKGAAVVLLQVVLTRKGTTVKVRRELRRMFLEYECYIDVGTVKTISPQNLWLRVNSNWLLLETAQSTVSKHHGFFLRRQLRKFENLTLVARRRELFRGFLAILLVAQLPPKRGKER